VGVAILNYRGNKDYVDMLPRNVKRLGGQDFEKAFREDLASRTRVFARTAPEEMHRAGFLSSPEPPKKFDKAEKRVNDWYEACWLKASERYYSGLSGKERGQAALEMLENAEKAERIRKDALARDAWEAERSAGHLDSPRVKMKPDEQDLQDGLGSLVCYMLEGRDVPLRVRNGLLRIPQRQMRDKLAPDSEKRQLTAKREAKMSSYHDDRVEDKASKNLQECVEVPDLLCCLQEFRDGLSPIEAAAFERRFPSKPKLSRKKLGEKYKVSEDAIRWEEPKIMRRVEGLRKRLSG
jgi:hypothetical protein